MNSNISHCFNYNINRSTEIQSHSDTEFEAIEKLHKIYEAQKSYVREQTVAISSK